MRFTAWISVSKLEKMRRAEAKERERGKSGSGGKSDRKRATDFVFSLGNYFNFQFPHAQLGIMASTGRREAFGLFEQFGEQSQKMAA